jgi:hypothetical protein
VQCLFRYETKTGQEYQIDPSRVIVGGTNEPDTVESNAGIALADVLDGVVYILIGSASRRGQGHPLAVARNHADTGRVVVSAGVIF